MAEFAWITEPIPAAFPHSAGGAGGVYRTRIEQFDVAFGNLPFLFDIGEDRPYERQTAEWKKEQFDSQALVGEQSLVGWWLRSQDSFFGGDGITYYEPIEGEGAESRFRNSSGVEVFNDDGSVNLLPGTEVAVAATDPDQEMEAGPNRLLLRDGGSLSVWDGSTESAVSGTTTAVSLAYTGGEFLVGDDDNIYELSEDTGTSLGTALWTNTGGDTKVFWTKNRIFAAVGPDLYEATLAGGDLQVDLSPLIEHPDEDWEWVSVTETGAAAWAAGRSGDVSEVHVIAIDDTGATPTLTGGSVAIALPTTETVNDMLGYLGFLLIGTSQGFRAALTQDTSAALGPLVWDDEPVLAVHGRGDFAFAGMAGGLTRKVDLGNEVAGDLAFAWANHLEGGDGNVLDFVWFGGTEHFAASEEGVYRAHATDLVETGVLETGFVRYGTSSLKFFDSVQITAEVTNGTSVAILRQLDNQVSPTALVTLGNFSGIKNTNLNLSEPAFRLALRFELNRSSTDNTAGPTLHNYELRAIPAPQRKQRLIRFPLMLTDNESNRQKVAIGGPGFAFARLRELERMERDGSPVTIQDFRTGEARRAVIEQVQLRNPEPPDRGRNNFGGLLLVECRTLD